jgi:hypothetical protein
LLDGVEMQPYKKHLTRRDFLKLSGTAVAGLVLLVSGCSLDEKATSGSTSRLPPTPASGQNYLAVARGSDPAAITQAALASLGVSSASSKQVRM